MKTIKFLDHAPSPVQTVLGNKTDNGADDIQFELPSFSGSSAFLHFSIGDYTDVVTLPDSHVFTAMSRHTQIPGSALCYIHIEGENGVVWHSDPFTLLIGDIPTDSEDELPQTYPTAVDTALSALQQIEALKEDIDENVEAIEDFTSALSNVTVSVTGAAAGTTPSGFATITEGSGIAFSFTIPKGDRGATGATGATGQRGATGATGKGIQSIAVDYQIGTSATVPPGGQWLISMPQAQDGDYIWTRTRQTLDDGTVSTGYSVVLFSPNDAEAWASGTRNGTSVPSSDAAYHNNAKYYAALADASADAAAASEEVISEAMETIATEDTARSIALLAESIKNAMHALLLQGDKVQVVQSLPRSGVPGRIYISPLGIYRCRSDGYHSISSPGLNGFSLSKGDLGEVILRYADEASEESATLPRDTTGQEIVSLMDSINGNLCTLWQNTALQGDE